MTDKSKKNNTKRTRNWTCIVYPDSLPSDWIEKLRNLHINVIISPIHDMDINPGTDERKKPHYHIIFIFDTVKSFSQVEEISKMLNGTVPMICQSLHGMIRYTIHIDNPEKAQYDKKDIVNIGSYDIEEAFKNSLDRYHAIKDMIQFIKDNNVFEFVDFMDYCSNEHFEDWFKLLCDNSAFVIQSVITSNRHKHRDMMMRGDYDDE